MFLTSIVKRCIVFVNWKRKTPQEGFEPKRNLSCDSAECFFTSDKNSITAVCFSLLLLSYKILQNLHKVCVNQPLKLEIPNSSFKLISCNDQKYESLVR